MNTKAKSTVVFEVRLWSAKHYNYAKDIPRSTRNICYGWVTNAKTKEKVAIHSPGEMLSAMEKMYEKEMKE